MVESIVLQDVREIIDDNPELMRQIDGRSFLVTGSTGMIGRYVVSLLAENARQNNGAGTIIASARNKEKAEEMFDGYLSMDNFRLLISDVGDLTALDDDVDYILHAASSTGPKDFLERPVDIIQANVFATNSLLNIAKEKAAGFCLLSTLEVYGSVYADSYPIEVTEKSFGALDSLALRSAYPESKRMAESLCVAYKEQFDVLSTIVRLAPCVSPVIEAGDERLFAQLISGVNHIYSDAANKKRSYTYIADAISGILTAMVTTSEDNFVFNLANNDNVASIQELAEMIVAARDETLEIIPRDSDQNTSSTTGQVVLNSDRLKELGWTPRYSLKDTIARTSQFVVNN